MQDFTLNWAERLAMVALNMAANMTPMRPCGSSVRLATAYAASLALGKPIRGSCGYTTRIAMGGMNHRNAPAKNNPQHSKAILRAERSSSTLKYRCAIALVL